MSIKGYSEIVSESLAKTPESILRVHGGITYSGTLENIEKSDLINVQGLWWFGFDCNHSGDTADLELITDPASRNLAEQMHKIYTDIGTISGTSKTHKTLKYVEENCNELAEQLSKFFINSLDFIVNE